MGKDTGEHNLVGSGIAKNNDTYSGTFKRTVVKYFLEHDDYIYETANKFNVSTTALAKWIKDYNASDTILALKDKNGDIDTMNKSKNEKDTKELQNEQLLIENDDNGNKTKELLYNYDIYLNIKQLDQLLKQYEH